MSEPWAFWTLLAASMQSVRTAGQKYLTADISPLAAAMVRYLFGLPFALAWLARHALLGRASSAGSVSTGAVQVAPQFVCWRDQRCRLRGLVYGDDPGTRVV